MKPENNKLKNLRHSCAHLLAAAVVELYPTTKQTIGPPTDEGFYYDFEFETPVSDKDLPRIEEKMHEIVKTWRSFECCEVSVDEAKKLFVHNPYKLELIRELQEKKERITFYQSGDSIDLCRGGHVDNPSKELIHFKLLSIAGAYWRGDEKNKMLTRIYGTCFPTHKELEQYLWQREEAKTRDHRKLGRELDLFVFSELVGKGLPLFTPKGTLLRDLLNDFSQQLRLKQGFQKVWIPHLTKTDLYKTSGHWDKFGDELFLVNSQETHETLVIKPMNCPHHQQLYASRHRSYKELPIKYLETSTIYRDEKAGELIGLLRVRSVTQDDSHIFCTPDQINEMYQMLIQIVKKFYDTLNMRYRARLSFKDKITSKRYLGEDSLWEKAQHILLDIAKQNQLDYFVAEGEAAFYGPKIDFMVEDVMGRTWQLATPQLDFVQPQRFGLTYTDKDGVNRTPVMIHFALMGSLERFLSVYIEHTKGIFPLWLAPCQIKILTISQNHATYAQKIHQILTSFNMRSEVDTEGKSIGHKIRRATLQKIPYLIIIGDKEIEKSSHEEKAHHDEFFISVRSRDGKLQETMSVYQFIHMLEKQLERRI